MATPTIQLKSKSASSPDISRNVVFVWIDKDNPMEDSEGNVINTTELDGNGGLVPQYKEFVIPMAIPTPLPTTAALRLAMMNDLKAQALEIAKVQASQRAYDIADKAKIRALIKAINDAKGIDYSGNAVIPT
jgi:hypothetical protein